MLQHGCAYQGPTDAVIARQPIRPVLELVSSQSSLASPSPAAGSARRDIGLRSRPAAPASSSAFLDRLPSWHAPTVMTRRPRITRSELAARNRCGQCPASHCDAGLRTAASLGDTSDGGCLLRIVGIERFLRSVRLQADRGGLPPLHGRETGSRALLRGHRTAFGDADTRRRSDEYSRYRDRPITTAGAESSWEQLIEPTENPTR
jgi:hypothetical protein